MKTAVVVVLALILPGLLGYALVAPVITTFPVAFVTDGVGGFENLKEPKGVTAVTVGSSTYALAASYGDNGIQIINITDPFHPVPLAAVTDGVDGFEELEGARDITTTTIGSSTYAIVTASRDHGIQIINITAPSNPTPTSHVSSIAGTRFHDPREVTTVTIDSSTYALVATDRSGVHIINITDPSSPDPVASMHDGIGGFEAIGNSRGITTTTIGSSTYAVVAAHEGAVQIMDITNPSGPTPVGAVHNSPGNRLGGAIAVTTITSGSSTYALVAASVDDAVQVIDITDPSSPDPVAFVQDGVAGFDSLQYPEAITTVTFGSSTYALVVAFMDGVQIIDVTNPSSPTPAGSVASFDARFDGFPLPEDVAVIEVDSKTYALVASSMGNGVQIINVDLTSGPVVASATLNEEAGILEITFLDTVDTTPANAVDLSGLTIRDSGQSVSLAGATLKTDIDSAVISIELTRIQSRSVAAMASPQLDISGSAVTDTAGNPIELSLGNAITVNDDVAPEIVSVIMDVTTGILEITFSDAIDVTPASMVYTEDMTIRDSRQSVSLAGATLRTDVDSAVISIELTEGQLQSFATLVSPLLDIIYYGIVDTAGNPIEPSSDNAITVKNTNEPEPPTFQSAIYTADNGQFTITFSEPINGTTHLDRLHVRDADQSSGGVTMAGAASRSVSGDTMTITLVASQVTAINDLMIPQLDIDRGAVFNLAGTSIADTPDLPIILINTSPTVDAGDDQAVSEGDTVTLNGIASDADDDAMTYSWSHDSALPITISDTTALSTTFTAPTVGADTTVTLVLSVSDGTNADVTDQVTITIRDVPANIPPTVDAGDDQTVSEGDTVTLNGTAADAAGDTLTYLWSHDSDLEITLDDPSAPSASFTAPPVTSNATVTFTMTVTDQHNAIGSDAAVVAILDVPDDPPDTAVNPPRSNSVVLDPPEQRGSRDIGRITLTSATPGVIGASWEAPSEAPVNYRISWAKAGESYLTWTDLTGNAFPTDPAHTITGLEGGEAYKVKVRASYAGTAGDWSGEITITAAGSANSPPTADAGTAQTAQEGATVTLSGTASDPDGDSLTYLWTHNSTALDIIFENATAPITTFTAPQVDFDTAIAMTLTVDDGNSATATSSVIITITDTPATLTFELQPASTVTLDPAGTPGPRDIGRITLTSTTPGVIGASWVAPSEAPAGYRISWAKASESYLTWTDLTGNAFPTDTSQTITGLEGGEKYKVKVRATYAGTSGDWSGEITITAAGSANSPPSVDAGEPVAVSEGAQVTLNATASDQDDDSLTYSWGHDSSLEITLTDADSLAPSFTAPQVHGDATITFTLTAYDGTENGTDTVQVTVLDEPANSPPSVDAGDDQTVGEGDTVILSGSATDPDGDPMTYTWSQTGPAAPRITFANASASSTTFTAPSVSEDTAFTLTLTADDGTQSATDTLNVTVKETGAAFITTWAVSNSDRNITLPMKGTYSILWGDGSHSPDVSGPRPHTYGAAGTYTVTVLGGGLESIYLYGDAANAHQLKSIEQWGDTKWTSMHGAFGGAANMVYRATDVPDLSGVTDTSSMFRSTTAFNGDLSGWDVSSVTDMNRMFAGAASFNQPLSGWDVSSVTDMNRMFAGAASFNQPLSGWDVSSVTDMNSMFYTASSFDGDLSGWDVSSVTDMGYMFFAARAFNGDLSGWDVSSVTSMYAVFLRRLLLQPAPLRLGRLVCHRHEQHVL